MENKCAECVREDWSTRFTNADHFSCGDGEFVSIIINTIECRRANHSLIFSCSITLVLHPMTLLPRQPQATRMMLFSQLNLECFSDTLVSCLVYFSF